MTLNLTPISTTQQLSFSVSKKPLVEDKKSNGITKTQILKYKNPKVFNLSVHHPVSNEAPVHFQNKQPLHQKKLHFPLMQSLSDKSSTDSLANRWYACLNK